MSSIRKSVEEENIFDVVIGSKKKQENSRKTSTAASLTTLKPLTVWITTNCGKIFLNFLIIIIIFFYFTILYWFCHTPTCIRRGCKRGGCMLMYGKTWEYQITLPASWEICIKGKKQQNQIWNNGLVQNWERSTSRLYIITLLI